MLKELFKNLFGKKKEKELPGNTPAANHADCSWNRLWEAYGSGKLDEIDHGAYLLCEYESGINGDGHSCYIFNCVNGGQDMPAMLDELKKVLPQQFYEYFKKAYDSNETDKEDEICTAADDYFYKNEEEIIGILQKVADEKF